MRERHADELELGNGTTLTPEQYTALLTYIQALRDLPAQPGAGTAGGVGHAAHRLQQLQKRRAFPD